MKGSYILILECIKDCEINVGSLGNIPFKKGFYIYIGSAMNNLEKRVMRHLSRKKKVFWHIDYLTTSGNFRIIKVFIKISDQKEESKIAKYFEKYFDYVKGFGSTDCKHDASHLFYTKDINKIYRMLKNLRFKEFDMKSFAAAEQ